MTELMPLTTAASDDVTSACTGSECSGEGGGRPGGGYGGGGGEFDEEIEAVRRLRDHLIVGIYTPIMVFGVIGNTLSFVVMVKKTRRSSTHNYLSTLCVMDTLFLVSSVIGWLIEHFWDIDTRLAIDCNFVYFFNRVPKHMSSWLLIAITMERLLVVYLPTKAKVITQVKAARVTIGALLVLMVAFEWLSLGAYKDDGKSYSFNPCQGRSPRLQVYVDQHAWVRAAVYSFIPSVMLVIINAAIATKFVMASRANCTKVGSQGE